MSNRLHKNKRGDVRNAAGEGSLNKAFSPVIISQTSLINGLLSGDALCL